MIQAKWGVFSTWFFNFAVRLKNQLFPQTNTRELCFPARNSRTLMLHTGIFPGSIVCCEAEKMLWSQKKKWSRLQLFFPSSNSKRQQQQELLSLPWDLQNILERSCFIPVFSLQAFKTKEFSHQELWKRCWRHENGKGASSKHCGVVRNIWEVWCHGAGIPMEKRTIAERNIPWALDHPGSASQALWWQGKL